MFSFRLGRLFGVHRFQTAVVHSDGTGVLVDVEYEQLASQRSADDFLHLLRCQPIVAQPASPQAEQLERLATLSDELVTLLARLREGISSPDDSKQAPPDLDTLSTREREVAELLFLGQRSAEIATGLNISPHTVRNHVKAIFRKLGVHSHVELLRGYNKKPD